MGNTGGLPGLDPHLRAMAHFIVAGTRRLPRNRESGRPSTRLSWAM